MPEIALNSLDHCLVAGRPGAPVVIVLGGISASRDVRGWWPAVVGEGRPIDTREYRVLGVDVLDGGERPDGRPEREVTTHDQADLVATALDELGVDVAHAFVGASYGGMVGLAFAERYPERIEQLAIISAPAQAHPMSTALRSIQRRIVELGLDSDRQHEAMSIARGLAMTTYRSAAEFEERFGPRAESREPIAQSREPRAAVDSYLRHQGDKFARVFSPARFLALSLSADNHRVNPAAITVPALLIAAAGDTIVPREQILDLAAKWGGPVRFAETQTRTGHDAFLAEPKVVGQLLQNLLTTSVFA
jgi:homoserine O-acetyltransferase